MNIFEFILILVGMVIIGLWGLIILASKFGLLDKKDE